MQSIVCWVVLLFLGATYISPILCFINMSPAEIVSPNDTFPLEFAVGSNVTIQCRLRQPDGFEVTKMTMFSKSNKQLNVTVVGDDAIETTLQKVSLNENEIILCRQDDRFLARQTLCFGYAPSSEMQVSCQWYPRHNLSCCVHSQQAQDTLCSVKWTMEYCKTDCQNERSWEPFTNQYEVAEFKETKWCVSRPEQNVYHYEEITIRATATNNMGTSQASFTFLPVKYAVPGAVKNLQVFAKEADPTSLLITWYHNPNLGDTVCEGMGGLFYTIRVSSEQDYNNHSLVYTADCNKTYRKKQQYIVRELIPYTLYNVTLTPFSSHLTGPTSSAQNTTSQSRPLKAPKIVGWSSSRVAHGIVIYWKTLNHIDKGGPIIAYNFNEVSSMTSKRHNHTFSTINSAAHLTNALVTSPRILQGCSGGCEITLTASTVIGHSPPAVVSIPSQSQGQRLLMVYTEIESDGSRMVSWEGSEKVISVVWCYGDSFTSDSSIVMCQTEIQEEALTMPDNKHLVAKPKFTMEQHLLTDLTKMCENCQWHFAVRVSDTDLNTGVDLHRNADRNSGSDSDMSTKTDKTKASDGDMLTDFDHRRGSVPVLGKNIESDLEGNPLSHTGSQSNKKLVSYVDKDGGFNTDGSNNSNGERQTDFKTDFDNDGDSYHDSVTESSRLLWHQCQFSFDGEAPLSQASVREGQRPGNLIVQVDSVCNRYGHTSRPYAAQVTYNDSNSGCLKQAGSNHTAPLQMQDGRTMSGEVTLTDMTRGKNYTICVRLQSRGGWGKWQEMWYLYKEIEVVDKSSQVAISVVLPLLMVIVPLFSVCVRWWIRRVKRKANHFSELDFSKDIGSLHGQFHPVPQILPEMSASVGTALVSTETTMDSRNITLALTETHLTSVKETAAETTLTSTKKSMCITKTTMTSTETVSNGSVSPKQDCLSSQDSAFEDIADYKYSIPRSEANHIHENYVQATVSPSHPIEATEEMISDNDSSLEDRKPVSQIDTNYLIRTVFPETGQVSDPSVHVAGSEASQIRENYVQAVVFPCHPIESTEETISENYDSSVEGMKPGSQIDVDFLMRTVSSEKGQVSDPSVHNVTGSEASQIHENYVQATVSPSHLIAAVVETISENDDSSVEGSKPVSVEDADFGMKMISSETGQESEPWLHGITRSEASPIQENYIQATVCPSYSIESLEETMSDNDDSSMDGNKPVSFVDADFGMNTVSSDNGQSLLNGITRSETSQIHENYVEATICPPYSQTAGKRDVCSSLRQPTVTINGYVSEPYERNKTKPVSNGEGYLHFGLNET